MANRLKNNFTFANSGTGYLITHGKRSIASIRSKIHQCGAFQFLINGETINTIVIRNIFMIYKYSLEITLKYIYKKQILK